MKKSPQFPNYPFWIFLYMSAIVCFRYSKSFSDIMLGQFKANRKNFGIPELLRLSLQREAIVTFWHQFYITLAFLTVNNFFQMTRINMYWVHIFFTLRMCNFHLNYIVAKLGEQCMHYMFQRCCVVHMLYLHAVSAPFSDLHLFFSTFLLLFSVVYTLCMFIFLDYFLHESDHCTLIKVKDFVTMHVSVGADLGLYI